MGGWTPIFIRTANCHISYYDTISILRYESQSRDESESFHIKKMRYRFVLFATSAEPTEVNGVPLKKQFCLTAGS